MNADEALAWVEDATPGEDVEASIAKVLAARVRELQDELARLRAAAVELLDATSAEGHYSDPAGSDERTERATMALSRLVRTP